MRVHRLGHIECRQLEMRLPHHVIIRSKQVGDTLMAGLKREVESALGIEIEDANRMRVIQSIDEGRNPLVLIESNWARATRR